MQYSVEVIASYIIKNLSDESVDVTHLKLQKLLYFLQKEFIQKQSKLLFNNSFEAWVHGPVNPVIYKKYASHGWDIITPPIFGLNFIDKNTKNLIKKYLQKYKYKSGRELEELSHQDYAWIKAREGIPYYAPSKNKILIEDIKRS